MSKSIPPKESDTKASEAKKTADILFHSTPSGGKCVRGTKHLTPYQERLQEKGLPLRRLGVQVAPPQQFHIAQLAATMSRSTDEDDLDQEQSVTDLAARALQLWNASGGVLLASQHIEVVTRGLLYFDATDWTDHALDLRDCLDDARSALPGQVDGGSQSWKAARKAGSSVEVAWRRMRHKDDDILKALFPGKAETERTREEKFCSLIEYARDRFLCEPSTKDGGTNRRQFDASLADAWSPLAIARDETGAFSDKIEEARLADPKGFLDEHTMLMFPWFVRWLVLMRQRQLTEGKVRGKAAETEARPKWKIPTVDDTIRKSLFDQMRAAARE